MLEQFTRVAPYTGPSFPLQTVLELACAAQRVNKEYVKSLEAVYADDSAKVMYYKYPNRTLMESVLGEDKTKYSPEYPRPQLLCTNLNDKELADNIQKYYRRLAFAAIQGENEFQTEINSLLNSESVQLNKFGFIACLPSVYARDYAKNRMDKMVKELDPTFLATEGSNVIDKDCEIINCMRSKNFDAWNIDAIIDNKLVSWMSKHELNIGPCVVVKGKVKGTSMHWRYTDVGVTRLNYVKAAQ